MRTVDWSCRAVALYILGLPLWWALGVDFIMPHCLVGVLLLLSARPHAESTLGDHVLLCIIVTLGVSAYVGGFLIAGENMRFVAALYNLSLWICGFLIVQQVRHLLERGPANRAALLRAGCWGFALFTIVASGAFVLGYVLHEFLLVVPSVFGMTLGKAVPPGAALLEQSTRLVFARPDWGLPGVPMPRVTVYGPYPTATGAIAAVLGTLALLYLQSVRRAPELAILAVEGLIVLLLAFTLTRSILGGWIAGAIVANLVFGTAYRRVAASAALAAAILVAALGDSSSAVGYREYSSESRFANYARAFNETVSTNPVLGLGIKPREEGNHIPIGSHSTVVSSFTKGGTLAFSLVFTYLVLMPTFRWLAVSGAVRKAGDDPVAARRSPAELRTLLNLQIALWVWLCFEDIDAPATAATLIFLSLAFIEAATRPRRLLRPDQPLRDTGVRGPACPARSVGYAA